MSSGEWWEKLALGAPVRMMAVTVEAATDQ